MIIVKGTAVSFEMADPSTPGARRKWLSQFDRYAVILSAPRAYGMLHDPEGKSIPRCTVLIGPIDRTRQAIRPSGSGAKYMGPNYVSREARVSIPTGSWRRVGDVVQIFYRRPGAHAGVYYHPFKSGYAPLLERCGKFYMLSLSDRCVYDDRGYVFP